MSTGTLRTAIPRAPVSRAMTRLRWRMSANSGASSSALPCRSGRLLAQQIRDEVGRDIERHRRRADAVLLRTLSARQESASFRADQTAAMAGVPRLRWKASDTSRGVRRVHAASTQRPHESHRTLLGAESLVQDFNTRLCSYLEPLQVRADDPFFVVEEDLVELPGVDRLRDRAYPTVALSVGARRSVLPIRRQGHFARNTYIKFLFTHNTFMSSTPGKSWRRGKGAHKRRRC
jgi:hypothetical protein